ncbi:50S ribosomal protein L23 [Alteracholeplasma palmae J233]|uniref:Large ribosomal subunit protein uL23 n=1 Tax=Alteracholeplasma palmae (strain ATCC 49389 / J233) TaxID=1318466 RepID=U4KQP2_ALTPJ|nr:50S ribosomal protein L23 [Alteracholeplasma palmae]CCV64925.1 50S ribosomal protein L23 [Alteracholeplasma palmae J233]
MTKYYELIKAPIVTEQSMNLIETENKYTFKVEKTANKVEIKKAIETIFNVKVVSVNTVTVLPKKKRMGKYEGFTAGYKKAVVKLAEGQKIDAFAL